MNLNNIKAVMFDIDGTLINRKLEMSEKTKYTLKTLKEKGLIITTNTGRPYLLTKRLLESHNVLEYFDYIYGSNGNEVVDLNTNQKEFIKPLGKDILSKLNDYFNDEYLSLIYYSDDNTIMYYNHKIANEELFKEWNYIRSTVPQKGDFESDDLCVPKAVILFEPEHYDELRNKAELLGDDRIHFSRSGLDCMEVVPIGISKGNSVIHFSNKLGINREDIMCFGDEESDVPALLNCFGVMVGGKDKIADLGIKYACEDVFNDGIYNFFKNANFI